MTGHVIQIVSRRDNLNVMRGFIFCKTIRKRYISVNDVKLKNKFSASEPLIFSSKAGFIHSAIEET